MLPKRTLESSFIIQVMSYLDSGCRDFIQRIKFIYLDSRFCLLETKLLNSINVSFKSSSLSSTIKSIRQWLAYKFNLLIIRHLIFIYRRLNLITLDYLRESSTLKFAKEIGKEFCSESFKTCGLMLSFVILFNLWFSVILKKSFHPLIWLIKGLLFFFAVIVIVSHPRWQNVVETSLFLKCIKRQRY